MAKCLAWVMLYVIYRFTLLNPETNIWEFVLLFNGLLGYIFGGKWQWHNREMSKIPEVNKLYADIKATEDAAMAEANMDDSEEKENNDG